MLRLGAPVTALSLSPSMDMLATMHVNRRGIYLWSNTAIYGNGADIRPSNTPVCARLPALSAGVNLLTLHFLDRHGHSALFIDLTPLHMPSVQSPARLASRPPSRRPEGH